LLLTWAYLFAKVAPMSLCAGNRKIVFIIFPSHKIIVWKISGLIGSTVTRGKVQLGGLRPSWAHQMCCVDCPYPSSPTWLTIWYAGRAIYVHLVWPSEMQGELYMFTWFCDTLVLTATSSSSSSATSSPFFFLPLERVKWPFFRLSLCQFSD
jgi:hypothetical protein